MKWSSDSTKEMQRGSILQEMAEAFLAEHTPIAIKSDGFSDDDANLPKGMQVIENKNSSTSNFYIPKSK